MKKSVVGIYLGLAGAFLVSASFSHAAGETEILDQLGAMKVEMLELKAAVSRIEGLISQLVGNPPPSAPSARVGVIVLPLSDPRAAQVSKAVSDLGEMYLDTKTNLIWSACETEDMTQKEAKLHCEKLGARLPTIASFKALTNSSEKYDSGMMRDNNHEFWSSSSNGYGGYYFNGADGSVNDSSIDYRYSVRCVL